MSDRLISTKQLSDLIHTYMADYTHAPTRYGTCKIILSMIGDENQVPTAYDIESKCAELKDASYKTSEWNNDTQKRDLKMVELSDAIDIVKGGGCDDEHTQEEFEYGCEPYCDENGDNI